MPLKAGYLLLAGGGGVFVWSGIAGKSVSGVFRQLVGGDSPTNAANANTITADPGLSANPSLGIGGSSSTPAGTINTSVDTSDAVAQDNSNVNGTIIYKFLRANGYNPVQAAGALASMWGESLWNPESVGGGGAGLAAWTPASSMTQYGATCNKAGIGNASVADDMASQLQGILKFVQVNGDTGAVASMAHASSVLAAANIWGPDVERFGINDVHTEGVAAALAIANAVDSDAHLQAGT
jgi:Phage tail lysozyme